MRVQRSRRLGSGDIAWPIGGLVLTMPPAWLRSHLLHATEYDRAQDPPVVNPGLGVVLGGIWRKVREAQ